MHGTKIFSNQKCVQTIQIKCLQTNQINKLTEFVFIYISLLNQVLIVQSYKYYSSQHTNLHKTPTLIIQMIPVKQQSHYIHQSNFFLVQKEQHFDSAQPKLNPNKIYTPPSCNHQKQSFADQFLQNFSTNCPSQYDDVHQDIEQTDKIQYQIVKQSPQQCSQSRNNQKQYIRIGFHEMAQKFGIKKAVSMVAKKKLELVKNYSYNSTKYSPQKPLKVTISELAEIYTLSPRMQASIALHQCCNSESQMLVFEGFMINTKYMNSEKVKTKLTLAKIRTIVVRRALNQLVDILAQPSQNQQFHVRMNNQYRNRYKKAGIPIPPARMHNSYLEQLFRLQIFRKYYEKFIDERLLKYLQDQNKDKVKFCEIQMLYLVKSITKKVTPEKIAFVLQKYKKPFSKVQIQIIKKQAYKMLDQYGRGKKRIGNKKEGSKKQKLHQLTDKVLIMQGKNIQRMNIDIDIDKISDQKPNDQQKVALVINQNEKRTSSLKTQQSCRQLKQKLQLINSFSERQSGIQFESDRGNDSFQRLIFG